MFICIGSYAELQANTREYGDKYFKRSDYFYLVDEKNFPIKLNKSSPYQFKNAKIKVFGYDHIVKL